MSVSGGTASEVRLRLAAIGIAGGIGLLLAAAGSAQAAIWTTGTSLKSSADPVGMHEPVTWTATVSTTGLAGTPGGTINFKLDDKSVANVAVDGQGHASYTYTPPPMLAAATHTVSADFTPSSPVLYGPSSASRPQTVNADGTKTTLVSSQNPSFWGDALQLKSSTLNTTAGGAPVSDGQVELFVDDVTSGAPVDLSNTNQHTFGVTLNPGTHQLRSHFAGSGYLPSDGTVAQTVYGTTVSSSASTAVYGQPLTVTVFEPNPLQGGLVQLQADGAAAGSPVPVDATSKTAQVPLQVVGTHQISALYSGDGDGDGANHPVAGPGVTQNVVPDSTSAAGAVTPDHIVASQPFTVSATISPAAPGVLTPTGTVAFSQQGTDLGSASLDSKGSASSQLLAASAGDWTVHASYGGATGFNTSSADVAVHVDQADTTTTVLSSKNPVNAGEPFDIAVVVTPKPPADDSGTWVPTGTVTFSDNGTRLLTGPLDKNGAVGAHFPSLAAGTHAIVVSYSGDADFKPGSGSLSETVVGPTPTPTPTPTPSSLPVTQGPSNITGDSLPTPGPLQPAIPSQALSSIDLAHSAIALRSTILKVRGSAIRLPVSCKVAPCLGTVLIESGPTPAKASARHRSTVGRRHQQATVYAKGTVQLTAGQATTIRVPLTAAGKRQLRKHGTIDGWADFMLAASSMSRRVTVLR